MAQTIQNEQLTAPAVCGIGASAGGIEALRRFFEKLRDDLGLAYVVIVHLAPDRESELPSILSRWTKMPVTQVVDHEKLALEPNHVYLIAPDRKLEITGNSVGSSTFEQPRGKRAAIDLFFHSLALEHGDGFAVVLSGSGSDGAVGARAVKERGGVVLVQDPSDAQHGDMPQAVIAAGVADVVQTAEELATTLATLARHKYELPMAIRQPDLNAQLTEDDEKALRSVLDVLRKRTGHDFSRYKRGTVLRRLARRMQLSAQITITQYLEHLRAMPDEARLLLGDMLISVTKFFRDPEAWAALQNDVLGPLVQTSEPDEPIRAWVVGCATGEEAYTLAILISEELAQRKLERNFIIFASDVDEHALKIAREGLYSQAITEDVSETLLNRYFRIEDDHFRVLPDLRDHIVFAAHNVLRDPPFSRLDLITCRNLLIYLDRDLQTQVANVFRYVCRDEAHLFLGSAETPDEESFRTLDKKHRIFATRRRIEPIALPPDTVVRGSRMSLPPSDLGQIGRKSAAQAHAATLEELSPPSVLVDDRGMVVHVSKTASRYFLQDTGTLARRLTDLVRPELRSELQALLRRAGESATPQFSPFISTRFDNGHRGVGMLVQPRPNTPDARSQTLVTFLDLGEIGSAASETEQEPSSQLVRDLNEKLLLAEQRIETVRDDQYAANEDLRAANEELQSLNEEYRSTTEELETSKEELQSINEELQTINHELKSKVDELSRAHNDLENLMASTDVATLFLNRDLRIQRFTPKLMEIFNIKARDQDRPFGDVTHHLDYAELENDARSVLLNLTPIEREIRGRSDQRFIARILPYRTDAGRSIGGVAITFFDVTAIKAVERELRDSERRLQHRTAELESSRESLARTAADLIDQDRHRDDFLAALGHELRNPLAGIVNSIAVIEPANARTKQAVDVLRRQSQKLARLVDDLLDSSRVKQGRLQLQCTPLDLTNAVRQAIETAHPLAESKNLQLIAEMPENPVVVFADAVRIAQILDNLLRNALTYTDAGSVVIALTSQQKTARVNVRDTGIGIDSADESHLFDLYYRGRLRSGAGIGLGLALSKALVEAHGGAISFASDGVGKGSQFWFDLPLVEQTAEISVVAALPRTDVPQRVLIVDDQADIADTFKLMLEMLGHTVDIAYTGREALQLAERSLPSVALLDMSMPDMSGIEVAKHLRRIVPAGTLRIVGISGRGDMEQPAREAGIDEFLLKPVTPEKIAAMLRVVE